jgi:APA family basic amino acid/polyamine antiporter
MSHDGLLPDCFGKVHEASGTPRINTLVVGVLGMAAAGFMSLGAIVELTCVGSLAAFALVCVTVVYLRVSQPDLPRPFRTPLFHLVPIMGAAMCLFVLMSLMATPTTRKFFLVYTRALRWSLSLPAGTRGRRLG